MEKMWKVTRKQMGSEDKMMHCVWIANLIAINKEETLWEVGDSGVASNKIEKHTLDFKAKAWWTLAQHRLCSTLGTTYSV